MFFCPHLTENPQSKVHKNDKKWGHLDNRKAYPTSFRFFSHKQAYMAACVFLNCSKFVGYFFLSDEDKFCTISSDSTTLKEFSDFLKKIIVHPLTIRYAWFREVRLRSCWGIPSFFLLNNARHIALKCYHVLHWLLWCKVTWPTRFLDATKINL